MNEREVTERERLCAIVRRFEERRIAVVGDLIADQFLFGEISRVSREAPVLILRHERTETVPGGAANCAMNLAALGASVSLIGIVGQDASGRALTETLTRAGVECRRIISCENWTTTTKTRVLAGLPHSLRQQVIRVDHENDSRELPNDVRARLNENIRAACDEAEAIIVSDYNYGVADRATAVIIRETALRDSIPILADSRFRLVEFNDFTSATPNEDEVEQLVGRRIDDATIEELGAELRARLSLDALLITRGKQGMLLIERAAPALHLAPVGSRDAVDVTGAGDTVIATYALSLAARAPFADAARLANHAGGVVVMKRGTATVTQQELIASIQHET